MTDNSVNISQPQGTDETTSQTSQGTSEETAGNGKTSKEGADETASATGGEHNDEGKNGSEDINPDTKKPYTAEEWKEKFSNSSRGAQELLDKNKTLTSELDASKGTIDKLTKDIEELRKIAEGKNAEGLNLHDLQAQNAKNSNELALLKEESQLDKFIAKVPLASEKREALRTLARAYPTVELQKLWDENLKAGAEAADAKRKEDEKTRKQGAGDKGQGTSKRETGGGAETIGGMSLEEFNKLPVAKRREILIKEGKM